MSKSDYIFISHSSEDRKLATALCHYLEERGLHCWITPRDINPGKDYAQSIIEAIHKAPVMILVFTKYANNSKHVKNEVERGFSTQSTIIPFRVENIIPASSLEYFLSSTHWLDAFDGKPEDYFGEVYRNCSLLLNKSAEETPTFISVNRNQKSKPKIKPLPWIISIGVVALLLLAFYFIRNKNSAISKADRSQPDTVTAINKTVTDTNQTNGNMHHLAGDTSQHVPGEKLSIKEPKNTLLVSQKVTPEKKDNEKLTNERADPAEDLNSAEWIQITKTDYWEMKSSDQLSFPSISGNMLSFSGKISGNPVFGTLRILKNKNCKVVKGNVTGELTFFDDNERIKGNFTFESGYTKGLDLEKKVY